jgi:type I restriction enzyme M protein
VPPSGRIGRVCPFPAPALCRILRPDAARWRGHDPGESMFEQTFKNIDDILHKDAGCTSELDYTEQSSWLLFLKYLDALEQDKAMEAQLEGKTYRHIIDAPYRWEAWAAPKAPDGTLDHNAAMTGDDLRDFVNGKLFPYLHGFKQRASGPQTIEYKIGEVFGEIKNKIQSGYNLRDVIERVDELRFRSQTEKHELSHLYEAKIKNMGNAGRNGGEYYTPRPLIRAMIKVLDPKIGERIYDGACGSAGFLCEAFDYLLPKATKADDLKTLQARTFYGKEKKSLAYVIAIMNMILHGIEAPNVIHANTLAENIADIQERDRYDVILANPPFGGKERKEVQQNFPIKTGETAFLFLQHFIKTLKAGGRAAIVIKNTFLSNTDNASTSIRKLLLESCNLHTVLDLPGGTFQGAGVKTVVLFFEKGAPTRKVWFYQLNPGRNMGKTNPLNDDDLVEFIERQKNFADSAQSWSVDVAGIDATTCDLSVKNPKGGGEVAMRAPQDILDEIGTLDAESAEVLAAIRGLLV